MAHIVRTLGRMAKQQHIAEWLHVLTHRLIEGVVSQEELGITEGTVLCTGPAPYRRLDCDGRALAYIRSRPRKRAVRIDVTGLWRAPGRSRLVIPAAGGTATLLVRSEADLSDAIRFLVRAVERTRGPAEESDALVANG